MTRIVKPAKCESEMIVAPCSPCEMRADGYPGIMRINGTVYTVTILGYLPEVGSPIIDGFRLTKDNGESHDLCLVAGELTCTCGDFEFRRASRDPKGCKHCIAVRKHLEAPRDQYQPLHASGHYCEL